MTLSSDLDSVCFYSNLINFNGLFFTILRLYFILNINFICGINLSTLHLTLNISNSELT